MASVEPSRRDIRSLSGTATDDADDRVGNWRCRLGITWGVPKGWATIQKVEGITKQLLQILL